MFRSKFWRFRIENFKLVPLYLIKLWPLKVFGELYKSLLLLANIVKCAASGLRQFLATESPWKIMKNTFYFILTNWICYWQIRFWTYYAFSLNHEIFGNIGHLKMVSDQFRKSFTGPPFCGGWTKKYCQVCCYFCVLAIKLI